MLPSDERKKFILEFLSAADMSSNMKKDVIPNLFSVGRKQNFTDGQLEDALVSMDNHHDFLLNIEMIQVLGHTQPWDRAVPLQPRWVNQSGEDALYNLQHPTDGTSTNEPRISINNLNASGQTVFGNHASLTDNHSVADDHSMHFDIDKSIHQLLSVENQLPDNSDKEQLRDLAAELESALKSSETPKPKFLSRFKDFVGKTWKVTGPVITPLLVELGKQAFF